MDTANTLIDLSGPEILIPSDEKTAYRVVSGTVLVFVAPWEKEAPGRRLLLCQVEPGRVIPSFVYQDSDYKSWRFVLMAREQAQLQRMEQSVTSVLLRNFARQAGLEQFSQEGFHQSLVDFYHRERLKDNVYIHRGRKQAPDVNIASYGVIKQAFNVHTEYGTGNDPLYNAVVYACKKRDIPVVSMEQLLQSGLQTLTVPDIAHASRFACRRVVLEADWQKNDCGVIISKVDGVWVSCIPKGAAGYDIYFTNTARSQKLTRELARKVEPQAYTISRSLPRGSLKTADLVRFCFKSLDRSDLIAMAVLTLITTGIGVLLPVLTQKVYDEYIPLGNFSHLIQLCLVICSFMLGNLLFGIVKKLSENRLTSRCGYDLQNALYYRIFHLPETFFRRYDSADLAQRLGSGATLAGTAMNALVITGIGTVMSAVYLIRMFRYSSKLTWWSLLMIVVYAGVECLLSLATMRHQRIITENSGKASARLYQFLGGIEKLRTAGVEDRAAYEYLVPFSRMQTWELRKNRIEALNAALDSVISTIFSMLLYLILIKSKQSVSIGAFVAFNAAFGAFSGAVLELSNQMIGLLQLKPLYERFKPIAETAQEDEEDRELVSELSGDISLDHVTFSYTGGTPNVLEDINLHIRPGEYVGIVGASGCGKSTLLKLLLGFEQPLSGQICYDGRDLRSLDKRQLRKQLGVVLQNGKLIAGSIYENITITCPQATMKQVQAVVEAVGLKEDIERMPMGLHTMLSENAGTISGGQQQRILIARAILHQPAVLIFDEATSALDNLTQQAVCDSLARMNVTRIVVAHRLSTIKGCHRILVLQDGRVAEEGNYEELMARGGIFSRLASRQLLD